ncbi:hypothetical protein EDC56_1389 [Sinobacterium caligoides]|uniref:N-acetyltransferase domain-containing protein n=1 Tax=Sinobacterium caligoides TaxID=933926 RepID=A0A3N2DMD7_9GAMM|nr:GNAT family N-acetyltransferase [Sinobacterium caligoides]ROS00966.1 hypothetical protein EDC56_1389 [Sinobacterium caligoides]
MSDSKTDSGHLMRVEHRPEEQRFVIIDGSKVAELQYSLLTNNRCDFHHTYVPFSMRGKGYAELLVEVGLAWSRAEGYQSCASCRYVAKFLQ